jgi:hypothetical protein
MSLDDNQDAWMLTADGSYVLAGAKTKGVTSAPAFSVQQHLIQQYTG